MNNALTNQRLPFNLKTADNDLRELLLKLAITGGVKAVRDGYDKGLFYIPPDRYLRNADGTRKKPYRVAGYNFGAIYDSSDDTSRPVLLCEHVKGVGYPLIDELLKAEWEGVGTYEDSVHWSQVAREARLAR